jgi:putative ABC transport system permease protein
VYINLKYKGENGLKKNFIIGVVFTLLTLVTFSIIFFQKSTDSYYKMINVGEEKNSTSIVVNSGKKDQDEIYNLFKLYLNKYKGNLYYLDLKNKSSETRTVKYVYFTDNKFTKNIKLANGRIFSISDNESNKFLSTEDTKNKNQIGQIEDFAGQNRFEIRTIKSYKRKDLFQKILKVTFQNNSDINKFISDLYKYGIEIQKQRDGIASKSDAPNFVVVVTTGCSYLLLMLLIFYSILNSYKKIAIKKMLGFKTSTIWLEIILPIITIELTSIIIVTSIMTILKFKAYNQYFIDFLAELCGIYGLMIIVSIIFLTLPFLYAKKISIVSMLKNKKNTNEIITFNTIIKVCLIILLLPLSINGYKQFKCVLSVYQDSFGNWEKTKNYAIIPSVRSDPSAKYIDPYSKAEEEKSRKIYSYFNSKGAILADFYNFEPLVYKLNLEHLKEPYQLDKATINPNYLKANKIFDENGNKININETDNSYILLVPAKLDFYGGNVKTAYSKKKHLKVPIQKMKIIWTKSGQKLFTYNLNVSTNYNNCVKDPLVEVLTESNGSLIQYTVVAGNMGNPFKIKVSNPSNPNEEILKEFKKYYDLSIYNFPISIVYDSVKNEIQYIKIGLEVTGLIILVLLVLIIAIIIQNIINYFEQNRLRFAIQQFHGYKTIDRYYEYFFSLCVSWSLILMVSILINTSYEVFLISFIMFLLETGLSGVLLNIIEKRKIHMVTKGG